MVWLTWVRNPWSVRVEMRSFTGGNHSKDESSLSVCICLCLSRTKLKSPQTALSARTDARTEFICARARRGSAQSSSCPPGGFPCSLSPQTDVLKSSQSSSSTFITIICSAVRAPVCACMMRVLAFWTAACVLSAGVRCVPLADEKSTGCGSDDVSMSANRAAAGCDQQKTDDDLNAQERHKGLLRELQELAEHEKDREREYARERDDYELNDTWEEDEDEDEEEDEDEGAVKEQNERDLDQLLQEEIQKTETQRRQDEELEELLKELKKKQQEKKRRRDQEEEDEKRKNELELMVEKEKVEKELKELLEEQKNDTKSWNKEKEKEEKQEELQELMRKMERVQEEEEKEPQQKREMENASDEATRQFERERDGEEQEEEEDRQRDEDEEEEDEDEELLEIEAELRKVAAQLHELRRG
ncbi:uncharacterized protein [Garra rufa]|uniref:uncharacterized protein n=1 Tax=Garra rufa TaxID=137080 RepID=UPI003CCEC9CA